MSKSKPRPSPFDLQFNSAQQEALKRIRDGVDAHKFSGLLLHGVTGSGKTAVYLSGMRAVLEAGRSAILLVPEIGLTPAVAADLHQVFGDEVAILHSASFGSGESGAVAPHQARRSAHGGGHALGGIRSGRRSGADDRGRRTRCFVQTGRDPALPRARCGGDAREDGQRRGGAGVGHSVARVLFQRQEKQVRADRSARPGGAASAAGGGDYRHASGISGDGKRAGDLAQAGGRNQRAPGAERTGDGSA